MNSADWLMTRIARWEGDVALAHRYATGAGTYADMSRSQVLTVVRKNAEGLVRRGMGPGDRVILLAEPPQQFVAAFLGALWAGVVPVPVPPPLWGGGSRWSQLVIDAADLAQAKALVGPERVLRLLPDVPLPLLAYDELPAEATGAVTMVPYEPERVAYLQLSSGSTGRPRAIAAPCRAVLANSIGIMRDALKATPGRDHAVSWLPLHHDMGLVGFVLAPLVVSIPVTLSTPTAFLRSPSTWMATMSEVGGTITGAPNFAYALAARRSQPEQAAGLDLSRVRVLLCGGEPIRRESVQPFVDLYAPSGLQASAVRAAYGLAESTLALTFGRKGLHTERIDTGALRHRGRAHPVGPGCDGLEIVSCGRALPGHSLHIRDEHGSSCPPRTVGEVWAKGPSTAVGYAGDEAGSRHAFRADGWLRTGDRGYLTEGGELYIVGRCKDVLVVNGHNIDPQRVEWAAETVPGVRPNGAVAFTRPGADTEEVVVVVECLPGPADDVAEQIRKAVSRQEGIFVADVVLGRAGTVLRTTSGKPRRQQMRTDYLATFSAVLTS
ncbi:AMP-binding protein [Streptomyces sp. NPDC048416]|uniref:AMP-binding protein n=1 Tax=Streptomyces sp. NPDC048416 TaxID=3365546 RepID=UPI003711BEE5